MSAVLDVDPYLPNAYSKTLSNDGRSGCRFDLTSYQDHLKLTRDGVKPKQENQEIIADELLLKKDNRQGWEPEVRAPISTKKWLSNYGLKKNKLDIQSLMLSAGFKKRDGYDYALKKPIPSKYVVGKGFVDKYVPLDGRITNVAVSKDKMVQLATRLKQAIGLFRRRMEWLTTESRRIFGVIQESVVIIILDVKILSPQQFDQYRCAVERVIKEQITSLAKFNLYRATDDPKQFKPECTPVSKKTIDEAIDWLWTLDRTAPVGVTSTCESVMKAIEDNQASGIYLFTMGNSAETSMELMLTNCRSARKPLNIVAYNCVDSDHMKNLRSLCQLSGGRFHAYGVIMELESYDPVPDEDGSSKANVALRKRTIGGVPSGAGVRPDVISLFEELEEAQNNLSQMEALIEQMPDAKLTACNKSELKAKNMSRHPVNSEEYMGSTDWINVNGLKCKRLTFYDLLGKVAFKHCDGVVKVQRPPGPHENKTDANSEEKLVNAVYCDQFAHVKWKDGSVVHVQITPETHRVYEEKVTGILNKISSRINWLQMGSRQLFGTIIERRLYIIIDTSGSMAPSLHFVKDKLFLLLQEQIRHKDAFNFISFGSKINPWRDRLVEVNEENLKAAWDWIRGLDTDGSTNTLGALKYALADPCTEGIYLLSDGRPDHPPKSVLAQVTLQKAVPIHTISFNCADSEANKFLCQLAKDTNGRYHYFSEHGEDVEGPDAYQSEDIRLLREEFELGKGFLDKVASLRDECQQLQWKRSGRHDSFGAISRFSIFRPRSAAATLRPVESSVDSIMRPQTSRRLPTSHSAPVLHTGHHHESWKTSSNYISLSYRPRRPTKKPGVAAHTKTSILRTLSSSSAMDWVLPESSAMLNRQFKKGKPSSAPVSGKQSPTSQTPQKPAAKQIKPAKPTKTAKPKRKSKFLSSKNWLLKHGLRAKKLLLLDALSEAIQNDRESSKLDTQILSNLLDKELSPRHESGRDTLMSNPYLEDCLVEYEKNLQDIIELYSNRLDKMVWQSLSQEERDQYKDEESEEQLTAEKPINFKNNRTTLMESLDKCGWPITENDIVLLEEEIELGLSYLEQSEAIRDAAKDYEKREVTRHLNEPLQVKPPKSKPNVLDQMRGQKVAARNAKDGFYYDGLVTKSKGAHHVLVQFDSGEEEKVPKQFVIPTKGAIAVPSLLMGDYVLTMVKGTNDQPCYVPGQVEITPKQSSQDGGKFYEVLLYNGTQVSALRTSMVKISKARYNFSVSFINDRNAAEEGNKDDSGSGDERDDQVEADSQQVHVEAIGRYSDQLEKLCHSIIDKQREHKSRQKRLHQQMKRIHREYKSLMNKKNDDQEDDSKDEPVRQIKFHSLDGIDVGEEVLARWMDEGWYYRSQVTRRVSDRTYMLQDSCGHLQQTSRDDIIADNDDPAAKIDEGSFVIASHPNYYCSYAPGIVDEVFDDFSCSVTFYDQTRSIVEREDVFLTDRDSYERDVHYIQKCEEEMVGQAVVARENNSGEYKLGTIKSTSGCRQYKVEFADGSMTSQSCIHVFGVFSKQYTFNVGDHCLSVYDEQHLKFLPGTVTAVSSAGISVKFINGNKLENVHTLKSFWISDAYFEAATTYYKNRQNH